MGKRAHPNKTCNISQKRHHYRCPIYANAVIPPYEPQCEPQINDSTEVTERDRKSLNMQLKLSWMLECHKIADQGILCCDRPWHFCDQKCVSLLYLSIRTNDRRVQNRKEPHTVHHMPDIEIQHHFLRKKNEPSQALQTATNMELGVQNQTEIFNTSQLTINSVQNTGIYCSANDQQQTNMSSGKRRQPNLCQNCGQTWQKNHKQDYLALGE